MRKIKATVAMLVLVVTLSGAACPKVVDRLKKLSDTIALFEPFVQSLGIVPEKLKPIIEDGRDVAQMSSDLAAEMSAATTRAQNVAAANKAQLRMTEIINRGHFGVDQRVMIAVNLISVAVNAVANFYSDLPRANAQTSEKELMKDLDAKIAELERVLKSR